MGLVLHVMFVLGVLTLANHEDMSLGDILPSCLLPAHCYANLTLKCYCALRARVLASSAVTNNVRLAMDFPRSVYFGATYSRQPGWTSFWGEHQLDITKEVDMAQHFCPGQWMPSSPSTRTNISLYPTLNIVGSCCTGT